MRSGDRVKSIQIQAKHTGKPVPAEIKNHHGPAVFHSLNPSIFHEVPGKRRAGMTGNVKSPLGPVQAWPAKRPATRLRRVHINAGGFEECLTFFRNRAAIGFKQNILFCDQSVRQHYGEGSGEVIVTQAGILQCIVGLGCAPVPRRGLDCGDCAKRFHHLGDKRRLDPEIPVPALFHDRQKPSID